jgi:pyroglutamyl-peptidase
MYPQPQRRKPKTGGAKQQSQSIVTKTCLITGFDKFGDVKLNPTELLVAALPKQIRHKGARIDLAGAVLPTCCTGAWRKLQHMVERVQPGVIVLTGLAQGRTVITVERFALNVRDYPVADNQGHRWTGGPISKNGPEAIRCQLPLDQLERRLRRAGFPCDISNHAGTFVCNETYYRALAYQLAKRALTVVFVHLPLPEDFARSVLSSPTKFKRRDLKTLEQQVGLMTAAVLEVAEFCAEMG